MLKLASVAGQIYCFKASYPEQSIPPAAKHNITKSKTRSHLGFVSFNRAMLDGSVPDTFVVRP